MSESHVTSLTKRELAAVQKVLKAAGGLLTATDASEMLVTYPARLREHETLAGINALHEFADDSNDSAECEPHECGGVDRPSPGTDRRT